MKYPAVDDTQFLRKRNKKFKEYRQMIKKESKKTLEDVCYPTAYTLQPSQQYVAAYINPKTPYKGLLVFHKIGAGKTCAAIRIAESWKKKRKIHVVVPAALVDNFRNELRTPCVRSAYITKVEKNKLANRKTTQDEKDRIIARSNKRIDRIYRIYSYHGFVKALETKKSVLRNAVLIIDEVQNVISTSGGLFYRRIRDAVMSAPKDLRVVLLSATPIVDDPFEIALTLNLLRPHKPLPDNRTDFYDMFLEQDKKGEYYPKNLKSFAKMCIPYVSYSAGAPQVAFPQRRIWEVRCRMTRYQHKVYNTVLTQEGPFRSGDILGLSNQFYIGCRMVSNIVFPHHGTKDSGLQNLRRKRLQLSHIRQTYSPKFAEIIRRLKKAEGPVFVYSTFRGAAGIEGLTKILEAQRGYHNYHKRGPGRWRFAIWTGSTPIAERRRFLDDFNHPDNEFGERIKVIFGSPSMKEGVSLLRVREVHITEPHWNMSRLEQVMGRAIRHCSHKDVAKKRQKVDVYIYLATYGEREETIDDYIYRIAQEKEDLIQAFLDVLKK